MEKTTEVEAKYCINPTARRDKKRWAVGILNIENPRGEVVRAIAEKFQIKCGDVEMCLNDEILMTLPVGIYCGEQHYARIDVCEGNITPTTRGQLVFIRFPLKIIWGLPLDEFAAKPEHALAQMEKIIESLRN